MNTPAALPEQADEALRRKYGAIFVKLNRGEVVNNKDFQDSLIATLFSDMATCPNRRSVLEVFLLEARDKGLRQFAVEILLDIASFTSQSAELHSNPPLDTRAPSLSARIAAAVDSE